MQDVKNRKAANKGKHYNTLATTMGEHRREGRIAEKTDPTNMTVGGEEIHEELNHHPTLCLTGHECFQVYFKRFKIVEESTCIYSKPKEDTVKHAN